MEKLWMSEHISKKFDAELETLRSKVLKMGGMVESQVIAAMEALATGNTADMQQVRAKDAEVNAFEIEIDHDVQHVIARRQPAASDLRMVLTVVRIVTDLERIGDEAKKIAKKSLHLSENDTGARPRINELRHMSTMATSMLSKVLDSFARLDISANADLIRSDQQIDEEFRTTVRQLVSFMMEDPRTISNSLDILFIAKSLERIGDHAKNIAEHVVFLVKGKDVRHSQIEELERHSKS